MDFLELFRGKGGDAFRRFTFGLKLSEQFLFVLASQGHGTGGLRTW
ncbi:hypothetical protein [Desulfoferula mesophila]